MLTLLGLMLIVLTAMFIVGLYFFRHESHKLDYIANESRRAELRAQAMGNQARARIDDIANNTLRYSRTGRQF